MSLNIFTLGSSKTYTNMVALGLASATVDDVNKSITFTLATDGSQHTIHFNQPSDGKDGVSVTGVSDKGNGVFTLLLSDGSESDPIQCIKGDKGDPFKYSDFTTEQLESLKGADGYTPVKGTDYWTSDDKAEIVNDVLESLPRAESEVY